jgi:hypothetical protein
VSLSKVSYDDPGADDAELLELHVERTSPISRALPSSISSSKKGTGGTSSTPVHSLRDAGADAADATAPDGSAGLTLGDCGLAAVELVNGQSNACETYRTLPLDDVAVPDDGYVVICSADTTFASACDVTTAGRSALKAGWLQNGPNDGLRLRALDGTAVEFGYEAGPACFPPTAVQLTDESGELASPSGAAGDDVNAVCDGAFVLLPESAAHLRTAAKCPLTSMPGTSDGGDVPRVPSHHIPDAGPVPSVPPWVPERAPAPPDMPEINDDVWRVDASTGGVTGVGRPPTPPGCAVAAPGRHSPPSVPPGVLALAAAIALGVRRRLRRSRTPA